MTKLLSLIVLLSFCWGTKLKAQAEKHVSRKDVNTKVLDFIEKEYSNYSKLKFYREIEDSTVYTEVVFRIKRDVYNIMFDENNELYEEEIKVPYKELQNEIKEKIENYLNENFSRFKIKKAESLKLRGVLMYEVQVFGKKGGKTNFYETYFDQAGNFIKIEILKLHSIQTFF